MNTRNRKRKFSFSLLQYYCFFLYILSFCCHHLYIVCYLYFLKTTFTVQQHRPCKIDDPQPHSSFYWCIFLHVYWNGKDIIIWKKNLIHKVNVELLFECNSFAISCHSQTCKSNIHFMFNVYHLEFFFYKLKKKYNKQILDKKKL